MPIQAPQWTDYLNCPVCCREFGVPPRSPISLGCGHTLCKHCLKHLHRKQCPFDQTVIQVEPEELVVNTALLQLAGYSPPEQPYHPPCIQALAEPDRQAYDVIVRSIEHLAAYLKFCGNANNSMASRLSRPMQRKLVTLLQCAMTDEEGRGRAARAARSLGERTVTELILQHQNPQQLSANLWAAVRARGCQFLGPAMQEEVLKLVLLALEDGSALSRKVLVMFVVQRLEPHFPQASKTSIGHVVQLLYRASCFKVSKRESDSSLMQLKEEFRTYESLRREHDAQIVQIATEAGLRIAPDQWSALLYGDTAHKSHMQSIIDKLQTPQSFAQSVQELFIALQRTGDPAQLVVMSMHLDRLANIDASPDTKSPTWQQLAEIMSSLKEVVSGLVHYLQQQSTGRDSNHNQKHSVQERISEPSTSQPSPQTAVSTPTHTKYKVSMCRDAATRSYCPRGNNCTFAHSEEELERYRGGPPNNPLGSTNGNFPPGANGPPGAGGPPGVGPPGSQPLPQNNIPMPPQQIQPQMHQQPIQQQQMYPRYPAQPHVPQRPLDNFNGPAPMTGSGMLPELQYNQDYADNSQPISYPQPAVLQGQPPLMGLEQNTLMVSMPDRNYWQYSNVVQYGDEPSTYLQYPRADYTRPLYGANGPRPMTYSGGELPPIGIYVPIPHDGRRSSSPQDSGFVEAPLYRYVSRGNVQEGIWQPNHETSFDLEQLRTSLPQCSSMPEQMFRVPGDRTPVGPERMAAFVDHMATAGAFDSSGADDRTLVEELQALERRIDTEYKSAD